MEPASHILDNIPELEPDIPATAFAADYVLMTAIAIIAALALLVSVGLLLRSRRRSTPPPSPEAIALTELERLEKEALPLRPCALRVSLILRAFLTGQTQDPALYETHEEFSQRIDSLARLPESCQYDVRCLLETLAEQKYTATAGQDDPALAHSFITRARELVERVSSEQAKALAEDSEE